MANATTDDNETDPPTLSRRQALHGLSALALLAGSGSGCAGDKDAPLMASESEQVPKLPMNTSTSSAVMPVAAAEGGSSVSLTAAGTSAPPPPPIVAGASAARTSGAAGASAEPPSASAGAAGAHSSGGMTAPASAGSGGMAASTRDALASLDCLATPEMTEGPFFVDEELDRSDLIMGEDANVSNGLPIEIVLGVFRVAGDMCTPLEGAVVDIWHADVDGVYSDVEANFLQATATKGKKFLRGFQVSDEGGIVRFRTIFPGWYGTRTVHIHLKIRGSGYELTTQLFFDETINDKVMAAAPYNTRGEREVLNATDQVFKNTGPGAGPDTSPLPSGQRAPGEKTLFRCEPLASGSGYTARLKIGLMMA